MISENEMILRLILSAIMAGSIGLEREASNSQAGLRTHILVAVGSCLLMLISMFAFSTGDPARLAAQVVSGIGFLGAGTILRDGSNIRGLTTAASLWVSAGIGLAIGTGFYKIAIVSGIIVLFVLNSLVFFEKKLFLSKYKRIQVICKERTGLMADIGSVIAQNRTIIKDIKFLSDDEDSLESVITVDLKLLTPNIIHIDSLMYELEQIKGVLSVIWKNQKGTEKFQKATVK